MGCETGGEWISGRQEKSARGGQPHVRVHERRTGPEQPEGLFIKTGGEGKGWAT